MIIRFNYARGNAVPETAFTMGLVLLVFLGLVKLSLIGYEQSEADGAAFVAAHAAAMTLDSSQEANRGQQHAQNIFNRVPAANIAVQAGTTGTGPNGTGEVVGSSFRMTSGLFAGALGSGAFKMKSSVVEPVTDTFSNGADLSITNSSFQNCVPTNPATLGGCAPMYLAQLDPSNKSNPYAQFQCHLAIYVALANGTSGSGTVRGVTPWPEDYRPTTGGSINDPAVRAKGIYLTTLGTFGTAVAPMYAWTAAQPC